MISVYGEKDVHSDAWILWEVLSTIFITILKSASVFAGRGNIYTHYQRALIASAATSALRLHQRIPAVQFNMEFMRHLFMEDSCHYLLFAILFINSYPITSILAVFTCKIKIKKKNQWTFIVLDSSIWANLLLMFARNV